MNEYVVTQEYGHRSYVDADYFEMDGFYLVFKDSSGERLAAFSEWKHVEKMKPLEEDEESV